MLPPFDFISLNNTVITVPTYLSLLDSKCIHFCTRLNRSAEYCSDKSHVPWKACVCTHTYMHIVYACIIVYTVARLFMLFIKSWQFGGFLFCFQRLSSAYYPLFDAYISLSAIQYMDHTCLDLLVFTYLQRLVFLLTSFLS